MKNRTQNKLYCMLLLAMIMIASTVFAANAFAADHYLNAYQTSAYDSYTGDLDKSFSMMGKKYHYGVAPSNWTDSRDAFYNLDKQFSTVSFIVGELDVDRKNPDSRLNIYLDNDTVPVKTIALYKGMIAQKVEINTAGRTMLHLDIDKTSGSGDIWYCIADVKGYGGHVFDKQNVTKAATTTASGIRTYTCSVCGVTKQEVIPAATSCNPFLKPYQTSNFAYLDKYVETEYKMIMGRERHQCIYSAGWTSDKKAYFNLGSEYQSVSFKVGRMDNANATTGNLYVFLDDPTMSRTPYMTVPLSWEMMSKAVTIPVRGITQMIIQIKCERDSFYALYDIEAKQNSIVAHSFEKEDTIPATETSTGMRTVTCTVCGLSYTETIPKIGYNSVAKAAITLGASKMTYTGKECKPSVKVVLGGVMLKEGTDYVVSYANNKNAGTASVVITGRGSYIGTAKKTFQIVKVKQKLALSTKSVNIRYKKLKKASKKFSLKVTGNKSALTYKKVAGPKAITISKKGVVKVGKGLAKGKYTVKVKVSAAATAKYAAASITKKFTVVVK